MDSRIPDYFYAEFGIAGLVGIGILALLFKLSADFAKIRTELQQQVAHELLNKRLAAYDDLWSRMRGLALYDEDPLSASKVRKLSGQLSDWYFGKDGGLFLTERNREFYFALQDVLRCAGHLPEWQCTVRPTETRTFFEAFVTELIEKQGVPDFRIADLQRPETIPPRAWRDVCKVIGARIPTLASTEAWPLGDAVFAIIQQVSSVLRSNLAGALQTRAEAHVPNL